jgi:hypothetical protein
MLQAAIMSAALMAYQDDRHLRPGQGCEVKLVVYAEIATKTLTYPAGSATCPEGCTLAVPVREVVRQEYGYWDSDWPSIRARQKEIVNDGVWTFTDWEDRGLWIHGSKLQVYPNALPPCPPDAVQPRRK